MREPYNSDESGNPITIIPVIGVVVGLVMALNASKIIQWRALLGE